MQAISVGKFRLPQGSEMSDKSDMPTANQIRATIAEAIEKAGHGPVDAANELHFERNEIRDFLSGRKKSLRTDVILALSARYGIPFDALVLKRAKRNTG